MVLQTVHSESEGPEHSRHLTLQATLEAPSQKNPLSTLHSPVSKLIFSLQPVHSESEGPEHSRHLTSHATLVLPSQKNPWFGLHSPLVKLIFVLQLIQLESEAAEHSRHLTSQFVQPVELLSKVPDGQVQALAAKS